MSTAALLAVLARCRLQVPMLDGKRHPASVLLVARRDRSCGARVSVSHSRWTRTDNATTHTVSREPPPNAATRPLHLSYIPIIDEFRSLHHCGREYQMQTLATTAFERLHERGRMAWPQIGVPMADFMSHLTVHLGIAPETADALSERAGDLYLALAAARGDATAISIIDRTWIARIDPALHGMLSASEIEDVKQRLRQRLFVGADDRRPKILDYSGRGELRAWVRASAVRTAISEFRSHKRALAHQQDLWFVASDLGIDPTIEHLRPRLQVEFRAAFEAAVRSLEVRERNLLKQHFLDGLSTDEIAILYQVHRATAFRWLTRARTRLLSRTRHQLAARLSLRSSELDSIMHMVISQLDVSVARLFGAMDSVPCSEIQ